jgi:hypothetical protein
MSVLSQIIKVQNEVDPVVQFTMENLSDDITGWAISFFLSRTPGGANPTGFPLTVGSGITISTSTVFLASFSTDTPSVLSGVYNFAVYRTDTGERDCIAAGFVNVEQTANPP